MIRSKAPARVLVIDDEKDLCELLSETLKSRGYETDTACNGEEGLEKIRQSRYHVVLSDIRMPRLSGLDTLEAIKRWDPHIEVILITAYGNVPAAIEALKLGAYDFIEKPFKLDKIVEVIEKALDRRELKTVKGLEETARAVFSTLRLEELLPLLTDLALTVAPAEDAFVALEDEGSLSIASWSAVLGTPRLDLRLRAAQVVAKEGERSRCFSSALASDARFSSEADVPRIRFLLAYPMWDQDRFLGVLGLCRTRGDDPFSAVETQNFSVFAALVAEAVRAARLYAALEGKMRELEKAEQKVVQSEKMAALGRIASGLAHEIKNPLSGILFNTQFLLEKTTDPKLIEIARDIEISVKRCGEVIENLLAYARPAHKAKSACAVPDLLEVALQLLHNQPGLAHVVVERDYAPVPKVLANSIQIEQVFFNILFNSYQAMPDGGKITVRLSDITVSRESLLRWAAPGAAGIVRGLDGLRESRGESWVVVQFDDQGVGIAPEELPLIFEPFYTTKSPGKGTGLGLSLSYEIVGANGGALWASSAGRGKGASFFVALPTAAHGSTASPAPVPPITREAV